MKILVYILMVQNSISYFCVYTVAANPATSYISNSNCGGHYQIPLFVDLSQKLLQYNVRINYSLIDNAPSGGTQGPIGPPGANGTNGTNGIDGLPGLNGANGTDGKDGKDGTNGTNGVDGVNGTNGINGLDGKDCNNITFYHQMISWINLGVIGLLLIWNITITIMVKKFQVQQKIHSEDQPKNIPKNQQKKRRGKHRETLNDSKVIEMSIEYDTEINLE